MSRLTTYALGALLALSPVLLLGQDSNGANANRRTASQAQAPINPAPVGGDYGNTGSANRSMPDTAGDWLGMLLSGGILAGAGLTLRRASVHR